MKSLGNIKKMLIDVRQIFAEEPNYIIVPSDKPSVWVGDTHGDFLASNIIFDKYKRNYRKIVLGDYVDYATVSGESIENIIFLIKQKLKTPEDVVLLRGNHEFEDIFFKYGFSGEISRRFGSQKFDFYEWITEAFGQMPYVAATDNGLLGMHGGLPDIRRAAGIRKLPKGLRDYRKNKIVSQIVWNDNSSDVEYCEPNTIRKFEDDFALVYGERFFDEKMRILKKNCLVRGHDTENKGYDFHDRVLTIITSIQYSGQGSIKGGYVAVMRDPQKELKTCNNLEIVQI